MRLVPHKDGIQQVHIGRLIIGQIALQASLLNLPQIILAYPALALAAVLSKIVGCNCNLIRWQDWAFWRGIRTAGKHLGGSGSMHLPTWSGASRGCLHPLLDTNLLGMKLKIIVLCISSKLNTSALGNT
jgi:hypothetical protein